MALAPDREYRRRVVITNLFLFRIVANSHTDVRIACPTKQEEDEPGYTGL